MTVFRKVAVALSGGIDSAVSAILLKNKGFDVIGTFIRCCNEKDETYRNANEDAKNAEWICSKLKIPFVEVDFAEEYWPLVFENVIADCNVGFSPNPDILSNEHIKFGCFHRYCLNKLNVDAVATGHYAKSSYGSFLENYDCKQNARLLRSTDLANDQTYVLSRVAQEALQRTMFPVGELTKTQVQEIASDNLMNRLTERKESSSICCTQSEAYKSFVFRCVLGNRGEFVDVDTWKVVGEHEGIHEWTPGQRCLNEYYVVGNDENNLIFVVSRKDHPALYCRSLTSSSFHWIGEKPEQLCKNRIFHSTFQYSRNGSLLDCLFVDFLDFPEGGFALLESKKPMYAAAPGQYAALYQGDECLGSMRILSTGPSDMFVKDEIKLEQ